MPAIDYLVGGIRISLDSRSTTPGPRSHINGFIDACRGLGVPVRLFLASTYPGLGRLKRINQSNYAESSSAIRAMSDLLRLTILVWSGFVTFLRAWRGFRSVDLIYERVATFQSLASFHPGKFKALRVVESNGILARESVVDRNSVAFGSLASWIEKHVLGRADIVVCVSRPLADQLISWANLNPRKVVVIPNGVSRQLAELTPRIEPETIRIGFAGSVVAWHHLDRLLETIAASEFPLDVLVEIIGDGPELARLTSLASDLGIGERVTFPGILPQDLVFERMRSWNIGFAGHEKSSSDVMYHSPLKLYEYAALGLDIVCTESADASAISSSGGNVHVFESGSKESLRHALLEAIQSAQSDSIPRRRARQLATVDQHAWESRVLATIDAVCIRTDHSPIPEKC